MWQLTPIEEGLRWTGQSPLPPLEQIEWACRMERLDDMTMQWHATELHGLSATVLQFALRWPPFNLQEAITQAISSHSPVIHNSPGSEQIRESPDVQNSVYAASVHTPMQRNPKEPAHNGDHGQGYRNSNRMLRRRRHQTRSDALTAGTIFSEGLFRSYGDLVQ